MTLQAATAAPATVPLWRKALPFLVAAALVTFVLARLDFRAFLAALRSIDHVAFLAFAIAFNVALLSADSLATTFVYRRTIGEVRYRDLFVIRGASYLPSIVNHHVGQAWLTYFLSRVYGAPLWRVAGATLVVYATSFGVLFLFLVAALAMSGGRASWLAPVVAGVGALAIVYAVVLHLRPASLRRQATAPLFDLGLGGHVKAAAYRMPHMAVQLLGAWVPFLFFGVEIPLPDALALMPLLMFVVVLPITPQGLGTREATAIALLSPYALGTAAERAAQIAATTLSWLCAITLVQVVLSPLFLRPAYRLLGMEER